MASETPMRCSLSVGPYFILTQRQYADAVLSDSNCVLELRGELSVHCDNCPSIRLGSNRPAPLVQHGLDREDHALSQRKAGPRLSEMQHLRCFVHLAPDAMTAVFSDD